MTVRALGPMAVAVAMSCSGSSEGRSVPLPGRGSGIGFDDLRYSATLARVLVPAGRSGILALVDPNSLAVHAIGGFSQSDSYDGTHDFGATSVDEGHGLLFVTDRTSQKLSVVDPQAGNIVGSIVLAASPDYVRYVAMTSELWISEPAAAQIEIVAVSMDTVPMLSSAASVPVANGPESLVVDQSAGRVYTHRWQSTTVVVDVRSRSVVAEWPNGCAASRGLAVDEAHGFVFAGCLEGSVSVLDATRDGRALSTLARGSGFDVIGYSAALGHLYLAGTACRCLIVLGVSAAGRLSFLGRFGAAPSSHCAVADNHAHAWVCDPDGGQLLRIDDPFLASW